MARGILIPEGEESRLQRLAQWSQSLFESVLAAIETTRPTLYPTTFAARVLVNAAEAQQGEDQEVIKTVLGIANLMLSRQDSLNETVSLLIETVNREGILDSNGALVLERRLNALLSCPNVTLVAQAFDILVDDDSVLLKAKISSSLRPLQSDVNDRTRVAGLALVYELTLTSASSSDVRRVFRTTLDGDDLSNLLVEIERAFASTRELHQFGSNMKLPIADEANSKEERAI